jgi:NAD(P)-dependent dehydrogenase (short-subunit alcohol dehydrogenase family)
MLAAADKFAKVLGAPWPDIVPLGRLGQPEEVADLVEFLLSNKSAYITGASAPPRLRIA